MNKNSNLNTLGILTLTLGLILSSATIVKAVTFTPPPNQEAPKQGTGGSSRTGDICNQQLASQKSTVSSVKALLPSSNYGQTLSGHPTILVYIPETEAKEGYFSIKDEQHNLIYDTKVTIPQTAGIVTIQVPENAPELEVGRNYKWYFVLQCPEILRPSDPVAGWIKRIEATSNPTGELTLEQAVAYADSGLWYELVATLALLRQTEASNPVIMNHWQELLNSNDLEAIANAPLI